MTMRQQTNGAAGRLQRQTLEIALRSRLLGRVKQARGAVPTMRRMVATMVARE